MLQRDVNKTGMRWRNCASARWEKKSNTNSSSAERGIANIFCIAYVMGPRLLIVNCKDLLATGATYIHMVAWKRLSHHSRIPKNRGMSPPYNRIRYIGKKLRPYANAIVLHTTEGFERSFLSWECMQLQRNNEPQRANWILGAQHNSVTSKLQDFLECLLKAPSGFHLNEWVHP